MNKGSCEGCEARCGGGQGEQRQQQAPGHREETAEEHGNRTGTNVIKFIQELVSHHKDYQHALRVNIALQWH